MAKQIRVGSVDLFQGQQAAVAITSLGSSSGVGGRLLFVLDPKRTNVALLGDF
jgi:superfamily I DNA and/or RNA helicase